MDGIVSFNLKHTLNSSKLNSKFEEIFFNDLLRILFEFISNQIYSKVFHAILFHFFSLFSPKFAILFFPLGKNILNYFLNCFHCDFRHYVQHGTMVFRISRFYLNNCNLICVIFSVFALLFVFYMLL